MQIPADKAKEILSMIGGAGLLKELESPLEGVDAEYVYYPVHKILKINMLPEMILTV